MTPATVLIAAADQLPILEERTRGEGEVLAFADTEALRALDVILRLQPGVVALERLFASTTRGTALINRIKADPTLAASEIRLISLDGTIELISSPPAATTSGPSASVSQPPPPPVIPHVAPVAPLDQRGTRRARRFRIVENVTVLIDGNPATMVDLSTVGAQVVSPTILKPNQRVRMSLPDTPLPLRIGAGVAWAAFELPKGKPAPQYRAGIDFFDADTEAVQRFIDAKKQEPTS